MSADFGHFSSSARSFLRDFVQIAGTRGRLAVLYVLAGAVLEGIGISLLIPLLGILFHSNGSPPWLQASASKVFVVLGANSPPRRLLVLLGFFVVLMTIRALAILARDTTILRLQLNFVETQQMRTASLLARAPWEVLARLRHARITQILSGDAQRLGVGIHFVIRGCIAAVVLLVQCVLAAVLAPAFAGLLFVMLLAAAIGVRPMLARSRSLGNYVAETNLSVHSTATQFVSALKLAVSQDLQKGFVEETRELLRSLSERQMSFGQRQVLSQSGLSIVFALLGAVLVLVGLFPLQLSPALLIALLLIVARMSAPVAQLEQAAQQFAHLLPVHDKLEELRQEFALVSNDENTFPDARYPDGVIVFENVTCTHYDLRGDGDETTGDTLSEFNITISLGEFLGVTGPSGGGKTTFADLLVALYPPQAGRILVAEQVLGPSLLAAWRKKLAYVPQDSFLFHDTIRRNLAWANPDADESEMWRALAIAGADDLVRRLRFGIDSIVGERGMLVSGGERQRIALARALLRNPKLLVLDEALNALDAQGERSLLLDLRNLSPRPTIVLIAHRTENLDICDRVLRLETRGGRTLISPMVLPRLAPTDRLLSRRSASLVRA